MRSHGRKTSVVPSVVLAICLATSLVMAAEWQPDPARKSISVMKNTQVRIDGDLADWRSAAWGRVLPAATNLTKAVTDPSDASLEFAVQWDENDVYFAGKGLDNDLFVNSMADGDAWDGDCIEFCLSFKPSEAIAVFTEMDYKFTFAKTAKGDQIWANKRNIGGVANVAAAGGELVIKKLDDRSYVVEAKIPKSNFNAAVKYAAGGYVGIQVALDDADRDAKNGKRKDQLIWEGDTNAVNVPAFWGTGILR